MGLCKITDIDIKKIDYIEMYHRYIKIHLKDEMIYHMYNFYSILSFFRSLAQEHNTDSPKNFMNNLMKSKTLRLMTKQSCCFMDLIIEHYELENPFITQLEGETDE